jgi:rhodanese-related sulfurtransferase
MIVDVRPVEEYARAHVPGSLSIAFRPAYATWLGWLVPLGTPLLFVTGSAPVDSVVDESLLIGQERLAGRLEGGVEAWERAGMPLKVLSVIDTAAARGLASEGATLIDVREPDEYADGHIPGAIHVPLGRLQAHLEGVPRDRPVLTYCAMGERSTTAASTLERSGFAEVRNLKGGMDAWRATGQRVAV